MQVTVNVVWPYVIGFVLIATSVTTMVIAHRTERWFVSFRWSTIEGALFWVGVGMICGMWIAQLVTG